MTSLNIRPSSVSDMAALDAMFARSYPKALKADYPPSVLVTVLPLIARAQPALVTSGTYFVAETDTGGIAGAGGWSPRLRKGHGDVRHVVTNCEFLRQGVASAIFEQIFRDAWRAGIRQMFCNATRTAVPFYQAVGFRPLGEFAMQLRAGISFPAVRMERSLDNAN